MTARISAGERTALRSVLAVLGAVPVATGLISIARGPEGEPGGGPTTPSIDSEFRFLNMFWTAAGVILWWTLAQPEKRSAHTRLVLGLAAGGGVPRLISVAQKGWPHPVFRGTIVLELVIVPLVLLWHRRVVGDPR